MSKSTSSSSALDAEDEASRESLKGEIPKISLEENSKQNDGTEPEVIDKDNGLRVEEAKVGSTEQTELVDPCGKDLKAEQEASRNSQEEPPLKKKKSEEKNCNQNDEAKEPMSDYWREF
ncbi:hypothetical protein MKX03_009346, partial [Papaver bracteatum]